MGTSKKTAGVRVNLAASRLTDKERVDTMSAIGLLAPASPLYTQHPQIAAAVDAAVVTGTALGAAGTKLTNLRAQVVLAEESVVALRLQYGLEFGVIRSTVEAVNPTVEECAAMGLVATIGAPAPTPLVAPTSIKVFLGKKHGQFRVVAVAPGRPKFGAQVSTDPIGPATWLDLPGSGRTRTISGHPSGTLVWVRFRIVRRQTPSEWSAPVSVTVP